MKHSMFSVFDQAAGAFLPPFILHSDGLAARVFGDCVSSKDHQFGQHPGDYALYRIGSFEDGKAELQPELPIHLVTTGLMARVAKPEFEVFPELGNGETQLMRHLDEREVE